MQSGGKCQLAVNAAIDGHKPVLENCVALFFKLFGAEL